MKCRSCRYYLSLTERDREQRYCNRCEGILIEKLASAMRGPVDRVIDTTFRELVGQA